MLPLKQELEQRGFLHQYTHEEVFELFDKGGKKLYFGADLSADSLTIGNFCALMHVFHRMRRNNTCYLLVGGATSTIGNPSGKDAERPVLSPEQLAHNQAAIHAQFAHLTRRCEEILGQKFSFEIVNNYDWFKDFSFLDFLRDVGRTITVNWMMGKDIVRRRITEADQSISFAEFSYMLIMGYDFCHLAEKYNVELELGGSDEWDGIMAGLEITHKKLHKKVYGVTNKLILDSSGKKFGKSEGNAIWLDKEKNSPYAVYQYFLNIADADVERFLKLFTFYDFDTIAQIVATHQQDPARRYGQEMLASYVVSLIFTEQDAKQAQVITQVLFSKENPLDIIRDLGKEDIIALQRETGGVTLSKWSYSILDLLTSTWLASSNSEAKKLIESRGVSCQEKIVEDIHVSFSEADAVNGVILLRKGKKNWRVVIMQ